MLRRLLSHYLVVSGVLVHIALAGLVALWLFNKASSSGLPNDIARLFVGSLDGVDVTEIRPTRSGAVNPDLLRLPTGSWTKIHATDAFTRQVHGGAAFDSLRGRLMLFGSDTHRNDWDNSVRFFDVATLTWSQSYPPDDPASYRVNPEGIPVAGAGVERPWAMHTFDAVEYDPNNDRLIVSSYPDHMSPAKSWGMDRTLWQQIKRHPTWFYSIAGNQWQPLAGRAVDFFPQGTAYDPNQNTVVGAKGDGYFELTGTPPVWRRLAREGTPKGWHVSVAYDLSRDIVVAFGNNKRSNAIWQYRRGDEAGRRMPTPGRRPPGAEALPLVYHPGIDRVVALVRNRKTKTTETWLYATESDRWFRDAGADLPFDIGMNYDMVYDPRHELLLLVANLPGDPVAVWALQLKGAGRQAGRSGAVLDRPDVGG